ncbi:MAG TPA: nucleotidyltransferase family protein [Roseiarcus sp.]|nr:nucleotidyltransferase family protein [Roseiarcus sp.]
MTRVAAVVLAAGRSSRFRAAGGAEETKLAAELDGKPIVRRVVEAALATRAWPVVVVVGHARGAVEAALAGSPATIAFNPDFETGIASSLRVGLAATPADADGAVVLLGDMPNVAPSLIDDLIGAFEARPTGRAVAPVREGRRGNPVLIGRALFEQAMQLVGDEGARSLLVALDPGDVIDIAAADDVSFDVDTPDDLALARRVIRFPAE